MELRELRSFCAAAKAGGISKAALELGLGQPTVTTHIRKLEEEMGTVLFDRSKRPIRLTPSGAALVDLAASLIEGIDDLVESTTQAERQSLITVAHDERHGRAYSLTHGHRVLAPPSSHAPENTSGIHGRKSSTWCAQGRWTWD